MSNPQREYWNNGQCYRELYTLSGIYHRTDGPAFVRWHENGQMEIEKYYVNGTRHRRDGPAITCWYSNGEIYRQEFWLNDKEVTAYDVLDEKEAFAWVLQSSP